MNAFILTSCDTDSITICKNNMSPFLDAEIDALTKELNDLFPDEINWEFEFNIPKMIVLKSKNYIMYDGKKIKLKGSSLKSSTLEPILKQLLNELIEALVFDKQYDLLSIYNKYIKMVDNITDIKPWCTKKTLSATTYASDRKNETNIIDAIANSEYVEGDRVYLYFKSDGTLGLVEEFDGDYDKDRIYEKLYKTVLRFKTVIDTSMFLNYKLKRNKIALANLNEA